MTLYRPGVRFIRTTTQARTAPLLDDRTTFLVGLTVKGDPNRPVRVSSLGHYADVFGPTSGHGTGLGTAVATLFKFTQGPVVVVGVAHEDGNASDANWKAALDSVDRSFGPGQVIAPGYTTTKAYAALAAHALDMNRIAFADVPDGADVSAMIGVGQQAAKVAGAERLGLFAPAATVDGGTVPASVLAAVQTTKARAGANVQPVERQVEALPGVFQCPWIGQRDRAALYAAGVNTFMTLPYGTVLGGFRAVAPESVRTDLAAERLLMVVEAQLHETGRQFIGAPITTSTLATWHGAVNAVLSGIYNAGGLYGDLPGDAFSVDTASVNTPETAYRRELYASVQLRIAEHTELVTTYAVRVPVNESIN